MADLKIQLNTGEKSSDKEGFRLTVLTAYLFMYTLLYVYKNIFLPALAEHSYFSAYFMLRIFLYYS